MEVPQSLVDEGIVLVGPERWMEPIPTYEGVSPGQWFFAFKFYTHDNGYYELYDLGRGEEYDEDVCLKRAEEFRQLTMDIAWDVFFYLDELLNMYTKATLSSSLEKVKLSTQASLGRQV